MEKVIKKKGEWRVPTGLLREGGGYKNGAGRELCSFASSHR
jgi:hypothetical protein